jgi:rhodanese-related sulfurtransferase
MQELSPREASDLRARADTVLVDVREPWEHARCAIEGALHIPLDELPARLGEIAQDAAVIVVCHHGMRSRQAALFLERAGRARVFNLSGGIDAWACQVDPGMTRY